MKALKQNFSVFSIILILFMFFGEISLLSSQEQTGTVTGAVTDEENNPLPGVTIEAWSPQGEKAFTQTTKTNKTGHFKLSNIPTGAYEITFSLPGFWTLKKEIMVKSSITQDLMIRMRISVAEEDITLIDASPVIGQEKQTYEAIIGDWEMETEFQGSIIPAVMTLSVRDGKLEGVWVSMDQEMELIELKFDGKKLSFKRTMGEGGVTIDFDGTVKSNEISGKHKSPMGGEYKCTGKRKIIE